MVGCDRGALLHDQQLEVVRCEGAATEGTGRDVWHANGVGVGHERAQPSEDFSNFRAAEFMQ